MGRIDVLNVEFYIEDKKIINHMNLCVENKQFVGLIGPNGCGKSTLLKNIYKMYEPDKGSIQLNGVNMKGMKYQHMAQNMAVVFQENDYNFDFTVQEIVMMGRYAHKKLFDSNTKDDEILVLCALDQVGLKGYEKRSFLSLSGGEKQRTFIARALAQNTDTIILDEPTNHLDIQYQIQVMKILKDLNITTFAAIHDLNIASQYCDVLYVMEKGKIKYYGSPEEILTYEILKEIFHVESYIFKNPHTQKIQVSFY